MQGNVSQIGHLYPSLNFINCRKPFMKKITKSFRFFAIELKLGLKYKRSETSIPPSIPSVHVLKMSFIFIEYQERCVSRKKLS